MSNHVHMLLQGELEDLSDLMQTVESGYALWFNQRHEHAGHVFQGRFWSEPIGDDDYLLQVIQYIHLNPTRAGICRAALYPWSSFREYVGTEVICDTSMVLDILDGPNGFQELVEGTSLPLPRLCDCGPLRELPDDELIEFCKSIIGEKELHDLPEASREERDVVLRKLLYSGLSIRQVERATGVGRGVIAHVRKRDFRDT